MRLRPRLVLLVGLATLIPLGVTGAAASRIAGRYHFVQARELHGKQASGLATYTSTWLGDRVRGQQLAVGLFDLDALSGEQIEGLQRLIYGQFDGVGAVVTLDSGGEPLAPPTHVEDPALLSATRGQHEAVGAERLSLLMQNLPYTQALSEGVALGAAYQPAGAEAPVLPVSVAVPGGAAVVGMELSLAPLTRHFASQAPEGGTVALIDARGEVLAGALLDLVDPKAVRSFAGPVEGDLLYDLGDTTVFAAFQSVPDTDWTVVVAVPANSVTVGMREIEQRTAFMYGLAAVLAVAMGVVGANQISSSVSRLRQGAERVGQGELGREVKLDGNDELAELARAFNEMSRRLKQSQDTIEVKNAEIEAWNRDLLARVEERTRELRTSQTRLVHASRLAAVAEMGAGMAHALNNPVAAILGMAQLARARTREVGIGSSLATIEEQAQRCREILASLARFSGRSGATDHVAFDLDQVLGEVLVLVGAAAEGAGQRVVRHPGGPLPVVGNPASLGQALAQLVRSLRTALGPGGVIHVEGRLEGDEVRVKFTLSDASAAGGDDWLASGMGLWIAQQVLDEHGGRLEEPKDARADPVYTVVLPAR